MAETTIKPDELVQIARLALTGRPQDVQLYIRRLAKRYLGALPGIASELNKLLQEPRHASRRCADKQKRRCRLIWSRGFSFFA